ncbi:MAG TPA: hypothetical protein VFF04_06625 [Candidatus Babeliales bacterium]|nr:hypothetical protein [Candidatus Babeliales bacterium]
MNKHFTLKFLIVATCLILFNSIQAASADSRRDDQKGPRSFFERSGFQTGGAGEGFGVGSPNVFVIGGAAEQPDATLQMSEAELTDFFSRTRRAQKKAAQASADTEDDHKLSREERLRKLESEHIFAGQVNEFFTRQAEATQQRAQQARLRERALELACQETPQEQQERHGITKNHRIAEKRFILEIEQATRPSILQQLPNAMADGAILGVTNGLAGGIVSITGDLMGEGYQLIKQKVKDRWGNGIRETKEKEANKEFQKNIAHTNLLQAQDGLVRNVLSMAPLFKQDPEMLALCAGIARQHVQNVGKLMHVEPKTNQATPEPNPEVIPAQAE